MSTKPTPVCDRCNDTHWIHRFNEETGEETSVMCTSCPTPCQKCRAGGNGPFCEHTPCGCECHRKSDQPSVEHDLKCHPSPFQGLWCGNKTHEIRKNDRNYQPGDTLRQREWNPGTQKYTGRVIRQAVTYVTFGGEWGIPEGFCVMSVRTIEKWGPKS